MAENSSSNDDSGSSNADKTTAATAQQQDEGPDEHMPPEDGMENENDSSVRFEDLTVDDDLPIIERVVRYTRSSIALQRLVHVKMLAETSELAGSMATQKVLIPSIAPLLHDAESVIRQHVAAQLLPLAITCMIKIPSPSSNKQKKDKKNYKVIDYIENPNLEKSYDKAGYKIVVNTILTEYLDTLIRDHELEVRRAAADAIAGLSLQISKSDVAKYCLKIPLKLAQQQQKPTTSSDTSTTAGKNNKRTEEEQRNEELRITAANLLAEMGGAASEQQTTTTNGDPSTSFQQCATTWVHEKVLPAILDLADDKSFRVRRCAAQAMPRILGSCHIEHALTQVLPKFNDLSMDDMHRVRKSTGECLVDMSRAIVILANHLTKESERQQLFVERRRILLPIAERLIQDTHKMVRQGMMQFLGPFMASFYPYQFSQLHGILAKQSESDGSNHVGIVAQFFPHATSMVSRLNSSQNATNNAPTPVHKNLEELSPKPHTDFEKLQQTLPLFIHASRMSNWSLKAVTTHREQHPPDPADIQAIVDKLLDYFVALAAVQTGDENTDAEMRVYCAYSFPAVVLLLGPEHWEGAVRTCFHTLLNPRYPEELDDDEEPDEDDEPPLPVKRCLASSLHTVAHILGSDIAVNDIIGVVQSCFLNDADDSVRLSTIRNFPSLLQLLPVNERREPFLLWSQVVQSDEMLGSLKRSATNPTVLNWRQRDYLARSLPELILLIDPALIHKHIWPILKMLLQDTVNVVRDDALWAIPILLKTYCHDTLASWPHIREVAKKFSTEASLEVVSWTHEHILKLGATTRSKSANYSGRQLHCRICTAMGLALRFGEGKIAMEGGVKDPVSVLGDKFKSLFFSGKQGDDDDNKGPYQRLSKAEFKHLKRILMDDLLPHALDMKEDRISNVRITLMRSLQIMPNDIKDSPKVKAVLKDLEEESETWTSFGEEEPPLIVQQQMLQEAQQRDNASGPIDVDELSEEDDDDDDGGDEDKGAEGHEKEEEQEVPQAGSSDNSDDAGGASSDEEVAVKKSTSKKQAAAQKAPPSDARSEATESSKPKKKHRSVVFEDGSIGMQLEPTADDSGCRVCGFLDAEDGTPSPARVSGKINMGDVIIKVNGTPMSSYDATISVLRAGGRRKISFRPGVAEDVAYDEAKSNEGSIDSDDSDERRERKKAKKLRREKSKKEDRKHKKVKKEKKHKKEKKRD